MKAAICSDIHGDLPALEAVLAAAANVGADEIWVVGDLVAHGPHPGPVVRRLRSLDEEPMAGRLRVVRGNTDRYVVSGDLSPYLLAIDRERVPDKERLISDARKAFAWTRDRVEEEAVSTGWPGCRQSVRSTCATGRAC